MQRLSLHAQIRAQQRGICPEVLDLLDQYGRRKYDHHGAYLLFLDKRAINRVRRALGKGSAQLRLSGVYAVLSADSDNVVVTVGHRTRRLRTH